MDYEYENEYIFDEWPAIEDQEELESEEFFIESPRTYFSFVISRNDNPPFSLSMELHDAKDFPHIIGIIVCIKPITDESDFQFYAHSYLKFTKENRSLIIEFPKISFKHSAEKVAQYNKIWQENQLKLFFKIKHWDPIPYCISNIKSNKPIHISTLSRDHSTCYLNAILSILYNIPEFRDLIFCVPDPSYKIISKSIPKELNKNLEINSPDDSIIQPSVSIPFENIIKQPNKKEKHHNMKCVRSNSLRMGSSLNKSPQEHIVFHIIQALQRLFAMMNNQCKCSTRVLTESFGWPEEALDIQHDAQEFLCRLLNKLKEKLPTSLEQSFIDLFYGIEREYSFKKDDQGVEKTEIRDQQFNIIPIINITIHKTLDKGLKDYFQDNIISENLTKRNRLVKLPKILSFHICRFDKVKNFSIFSYPRFINMTKYMVSSKSNEKILSPPNYLYKLFAVVVHKGESGRGHYYSYVSPTVDFKWVKFDDSTSSLVEDLTEVFTKNFGSSNQTVYSHPTAYILMYIHLDCIEEVMGMMPPKRPPIQAEDYANKILRDVPKEYPKIDLNSKKCVTIEIINDEGLKEALDSGSSTNFLGVKPWITLSLSDKTTQKELYKKVNEILHKNNDNDENNDDINFRLWKCDNNKFPRWFAVYDDKTKLETFTKFDCCLYIEFASDPIQSIPNSPSLKPIFDYIFFVFFDPLVCIQKHTNFERFKYISAIRVDKNDKIENLYDEILGEIKKLNLIPNNVNPKLHFYKEEGRNSFFEVKPNYSFASNKITIGSFVYVQAFTDQKEPDFSLPSSIPNYLDSLNPGDNIINSQIEKEGTEVSLFKTMEYEFPLSLTNIFSMFNNSLRFNVFSFGYMNTNHFYSIRVPGQMKLVDFKRYLAKLFGEDFNPMYRTDHVQIFKVPRLRTPLLISVADNPNHAIEIKNIFGKETIQDNNDINRMNNSNFSIEEGFEDEDDDIELVDDIYVQIGHNVSPECFFKRISFSINSISPTFSFQVMIPKNRYTVKSLFNDIIAPKLINIVMNTESKEYENSDFKFVRKLIESQTSNGTPSLKYDPTILRTLLIQNLIIINENLNVESKILDAKQEIRIEVIPEEQKGSSLISVALVAPFAPAAATGAGHPFLISVDGTENEIKERLDNLLNIVLMEEEKQSKESIIEFAFGKSSGEIVPISKINETNLGLNETNNESASNSSEIFSFSTMDHESIEARLNFQKFEKNQKEIIEHIKVAQKQKLILFIINNGLNPNNFTTILDFYHDLKIFD